MTEKPGIYAICHEASGKVYIGSASNISKRWSRHRKDLRNGVHMNPHLQAAWAKYGEEAFTFTVLELTSGDLAELTAREQHWIDATECADQDRGYNLCPIARSSRGRPSHPPTPEELAHLDRIRALRTHFVMVRGEENHQSKLTEAQVCEIKRRYGPVFPRGKGRPHDAITVEDLATEYGVHMMTISDILRGATWTHVVVPEADSNLVRQRVRELYGPYGGQHGKGRAEGLPTIPQIAEQCRLSPQAVREILQGRL